MKFAEWLIEVDEALIDAVGLESDDMPDAEYRDLFDSGVSPRDAAANALLNNGFDPFLLDEIGLTL